MPVSKHRDDQLFMESCTFDKPGFFDGDFKADDTCAFLEILDVSVEGVFLGVRDAAHTLKNYNEGGAFIPTIQDLSFSDGEGQTYDVQVGTFTEVGNRVFFELHIRMSSVGILASVINIVLSDLPAMASTVFAAIGVNQAVGLNLVGAFHMSGRLDPATQSIRLQQMSTNTGMASVTPAQFSDNGEIKMSGSYIRA